MISRSRARSLPLTVIGPPVGGDDGNGAEQGTAGPQRDGGQRQAGQN
jgi:hypothetical protein